MEINTQTVNGADVLSISGDFTVYEVNDAHKALLEYVESGSDFILDLGEVGECDTAAVQLLFSLYKTTAEQGKPVLIKSMSETVKAAFERIGMNPEDIGYRV